jgi:effector-binding domain-containing protein
MWQSRFSALFLALAFAYPAAAQTRVAPPTAVESTPLAAPPGAATPAQNAQPAQQAPTQSQGNQPAQAEPQPVQPPPAPQSPVTPQPVQPAPQAPAEPQPVQPPPTLPSPQPAPPVQQQQTGVPNPNATLAGKQGDPSDVDEIQLTAKPVLLLAGQASWDQGFQKLSEAIALLRGEADKAGLKVAGRPLTLFVETDDNGFKFEAMLPVDRPAEAGKPLATGVRNGQSPAGRSLRFVHTAPYDDIDSTYETITAYLEAKSIVVKDAFLEEYVSDLKDPADPNLEINVYVQPK